MRDPEEREDHAVSPEPAEEAGAALATFLQAQKMEAIGRLAGGIAHEFNNLLTGILGYSDLLSSALPEDDPLLAYVTPIHSCAERAAVLTRQLLAFSRKQVVSPRPLELNEVLLGFEKMLRGLMGEDVQVVFQLQPDLPRVHADPGQIEQVLVNLGLNAREAMPRGGVLTVSTLQDEELVCLAVRDTGTGMSDEVLAHLFEPFFTTKEVGKGPGLGLAAVHGIVHQNGGSIDVQSAPGKGTTITLFLPGLNEPGRNRRLP
jgi:signal transduction histidine kinase